MKAKGRSKKGISSLLMIAIIALSVMSVIAPTATAAGEMTATRDISDQTVEAGDTFTVTVVLTANQDVNAPALDEDLPSGWTVTEVDSAGATFKSSTNEWIWTSTLSSGASKTVIYDVTVPSGATNGSYSITGSVSAYGVSAIAVGESTITVGIVALEATRAISPDTVAAGGTFRVTVVLTAKQDVNAPALDEDLPSGWTVTEVDSAGATFKSSTNEWIWSSTLSSGASKTVIYDVTVPSGATDGSYPVTGSVSAYGVSAIAVGGESSVTVGVPPEEVVINEFIPNPEGDDNAPMPGGEWVELYNKGDTDVDVSGWVLYDSVDTNELYITSENTNTGNTIVPASGWLVVYRDGDTDFSLNQAADEVRLYDGYPVAESTLIDETSYTSSTEGKSWARIPDGTGDFAEADPTPGTSNVPIDITPPVVTSPTATPSSIPADGTTESLLSVTVTDDSEIHSVTIDLSAIGGSATAVMTDMGDNVYSVTTTAAEGTTLGPYNLQVNATDIYGNSNTGVSIPLTIFDEGLQPTVSIDTDTTFYVQGNTMHVGLDVTNPGAARDVRFAVWLELPDGGMYVLTYTSVTLPAGLDYSNPDFAVFTLPSLATGTYIWNAAIIEPSGPIEPPFICDDTWDWYFYSPVGTETPTEDITTVLEQAKTTVVIDFGK